MVAEEGGGADNQHAHDNGKRKELMVAPQSNHLGPGFASASGRRGRMIASSITVLPAYAGGAEDEFVRESSATRDCSEPFSQPRASEHTAKDNLLIREKQGAEGNDDIRRRYHAP